MCDVTPPLASRSQAATGAAPGPFEMPPRYAGLIITRLFAYIGACLRLMTDRRGVRLVKVLKTALSRLPLRIGAWCWQRKANRRRLGRRWKSFAESTGGHCTGSAGAKVTSQR